MQKFTNLRELMAYYTDQKTCLAFFEEQLWNGKPICPHCGSERVYRLADGKQFKCGNKKTCDKKFNVFTGTVYENTKIHLSIWLGALYLLTSSKKGVSSYQIARQLGVTQKTAWFIMHRLRLINEDPNDENLEFLVEVDETYCGGRFESMNRARRKKWQQSGKDNKVAVMGLVQRGGKAKLKVIGNDTFKDVVRKHVDKTAVVVTDSHTGYVGLDQEFAGHESVNHSISEYKRDIFYTNTVEGMFSILKRGIIGIYHQVSEKHLHRYCEEFSFRYNSRKMKDADRFIMAVRQSKGRLKFADLIKK